MNKLHKKATALLLVAAMLLTGCAEHGNVPAPGSDTNTNTSSDISDSNSSESTDNSSESSISSDNSTSTTSESSSSDTSDSVSEPESSSSESSQLIVPTEFTEADRELQEILKGLWPAAEEINKMFAGADTVDMTYTFKFSDFEYQYSLIPENMLTQPGGLFVVPQTYAEMEELLLKYFTEQAVEKYMMEVNKGSLTENPNGTFTVKPDDAEKGCTPFIEISGKMYCRAGAMDIGFSVNCETAKVIDRTDDLIRFSFLAFHGNPDYVNNPELSWNEEGLLKYERGGWKLNYHRDYRFALD